MLQDGKLLLHIGQRTMLRFQGLDALNIASCPPKGGTQTRSFFI
jgi:hypothetical protein